MSLLKLKSLKS
uniref:Uncharacterized protein n=1 Tax=Anguilla anguilla TaxID=7936 RepID=A0A0E9VCV0_ANGAN